MTLKEAFETGHLELLSSWEELTFSEFLRWLRARADQLEECARESPGDFEHKLEVDSWISCLLG